jgi:ParB/RepB/Spo0J family partition protein
MTQAVFEIALGEIYPCPGNRRIGGFDPEKLSQLAESIRTVGVQQPAVVRLHENGQGKYELVCGERRWRAAKIAGLETLPCVVREIDDVTALKIGTIENLQREDIHPLDEADGYARLIDLAGYDVEHLAQEVGRSISYVYQRLKLRDLILAAREMLIEGKITAGHAILVARLAESSQTEVVKWIREQMKWHEDPPTVRQTDECIHRTIYLDLSRATFKRDDAELVPKAGPCTTCQKRTGAQIALFADNAKQDYCADRACFNAKLDAQVEKRKAELARGDVLQVSSDYNRTKRPADVVGPGNWYECKKSEKGAKRVLVMEGPDRGRLTYGKLHGTRYGRTEKTPAEKERERRERHELALEKAVRQRMWDGVMQVLREGLEKARKVEVDLPGEMPTWLLRMVAEGFFSRLWDEYGKQLCMSEGWEKPAKKKGEYCRPGWDDVGQEKIKELSPIDVKLMIAKCALISDMNTSSTYEGTKKPERLEAAARRLGLDPAAIAEEVRSETAASGKKGKKHD